MSNLPYPVVLLAGGLATRLGALSQTTPKSLIDVNGAPFIAHQLRWLHAQGIREVIVCAGHLGEQIVEAIGAGQPFDLSVRYSFDGPRQLGTGGALRQALSQVAAPAFFVLYGDSYLDCDYRAVQAAFDRSGCPALMTVFRNEEHWDASNIEFANGQILAYDKKNRHSRMRHIDYGLGVLAKSAFARVPANEPFDLATLYQELLRNNQLAAFEVFQRFYEIGSPAGLAETRRHLASGSASLA
jgi:NDP-sugar pyrophosphorylase family protein